MTPEQNARVWQLLHPDEEPHWGEWPEHEPEHIGGGNYRCRHCHVIVHPLLEPPCVVAPPEMDGPEMLTQILAWARGHDRFSGVWWCSAHARYEAYIRHKGQIYEHHPDSPVEALKAALLAACGDACAERRNGVS